MSKTGSARVTIDPLFYYIVGEPNDDLWLHLRHVGVDRRDCLAEPGDGCNGQAGIFHVIRLWTETLPDGLHSSTSIECDVLDTTTLVIGYSYWLLGTDTPGTLIQPRRASRGHCSSNQLPVAITNYQFQ